MPKNLQVPPSPEVPYIAGASPMQGANVPPDIWDMQRQIYALQLQQLQRQQAQEDEVRNIATAARKQGAEDMKRKRDRELFVQSQCPHMKPNYQSAIGGQRMGNGHYIFICGYCAKEFVDTEVPPHLRIPLERVGGPTY